MTGHGRDACVSLQVEHADRYYDEWRERAEIRPPKNEEWARPEPTTVHALRARTTIGRFGAHSAVNAPLYLAAVSPVDS